MKRTAFRALSAALSVVLLGAAGAAAAQGMQQPPAQGEQEYSYPSTPGSLSPPSTLRMTVEPQPAAAAPVPVKDSPQSLRLYTQCRNDADRAAVDGAAMREAVGRCLDDLNRRRANGD